MKPLNILAIVILALFSLPTDAVAQLRYRVSTTAVAISNATLTANVNGVAGPGGGVVLQLDYPQFNVNAVAAILTPANVISLQAPPPGGFNYLVALDEILEPNAVVSPPSWALGTSGPLAGIPLSAPVDVMCCGELPYIYLIDSGVRRTHDVFSNPQVTSLALQPTFISHTMTAAADQFSDGTNHGTRVAGCLSGNGTGLLTSLGLPSKIASLNIYQGASLTTAIKAEDAIYKSMVHHNDRLANTLYVRNHGSILLFAHSTPSAKRISSLDDAVLKAWDAGMTVVLSAGNRAIPAVSVSPAGADWLVNGTQRKIPLSPRLLVAGAHTQSNALWYASSTSGSNTADAVDLLSAGQNVTVPNSTADASYGTSADGTSFSAGYTAATAAWVQTLKPWASPKKVREEMLSASNSTISFNGYTYPKLAVPTVLALDDVRLTYAEWVAHYGLGANFQGGEKDPEVDGLANMIEYYCGLDPRYGDSGMGPQVIMDIQTNTITVKMPRACYLPADASRVSWRLEVKHGINNPMPWEPVAGFSSGLPSFIQKSPCEKVGDGTIWMATGPFAFVSGDVFRFLFVQE